MDAVAVLGYSTPLPSGVRKDLERVAMRLGQSGAFLAVRYEESSGELVFLSVPERITVAAAGREAPPPGRGRRTRSARTGRPQPVYRRKAGQRLWVGTVRVAKGGSWSCRVELPSAGAPALLTIERKGKGATLLPKDAALVIPEREADALLALLNGLFARALDRGTLAP